MSKGVWFVPTFLFEKLATMYISGASLPKTLIYITDTERLQRVITACGRISEPQRCSVY